MYVFPNSDGPNSRSEIYIYKSKIVLRFIYLYIPTSLYHYKYRDDYIISVVTYSYIIEILYICKLLLVLSCCEARCVGSATTCAPTCCQPTPTICACAQQRRGGGSKIENIYIPILLVTLLIFFRCIMVY